MQLTLLVVAIFAGLIAYIFICWILLLRLGLYWAGISPVSKWRVLLVTVLFMASNAAVNWAFLQIEVSTEGQRYALMGAQFVLHIAIAVLLISKFFRATFWRSVQTWLPTLLHVPLTLGVALLMRAYWLDTFVIASNSMAPTVAGEHLAGTCSKCGAPCYASAHASFDGSYAWICENYHRTAGSADGSSILAKNEQSEQATMEQILDRLREPPMQPLGQAALEASLQPPDRVVSMKFLEPRRWDVITFLFPDDPTILYAMRVVGMPGESIHIAEGAVWADGKKLTPPDSIRGIEYDSDINRGGRFWGSADQPAKLGDDEYFVLGDFSSRSRDSRLWEKGAPGHPPYAVPRDYITGVVSHVFWPPSHWRMVRPEE